MDYKDWGGLDAPNATWTRKLSKLEIKERRACEAMIGSGGRRGSWCCRRLGIGPGSVARRPGRTTCAWSPGGPWRRAFGEELHGTIGGEEYKKPDKIRVAGYRVRMAGIPQYQERVAIMHARSDASPG